MFYPILRLTKELSVKYPITKTVDSCSPTVYGLNVDKHKALFPAENTVKPRLLFGKLIKKFTMAVRKEAHVSSALVVMQSWSPVRSQSDCEDSWAWKSRAKAGWEIGVQPL